MIDCPHRPPCPGCPRFGETDVPSPARNALDELARDAGAPPPQVVCGARSGFRCRARLAVRGRARSPKVGIFELGSHRVVDIPRCVVHHPLVNEVVGALKRSIVATGTPPYSDDAHLGLLRYVQVVVERRTTTAQVVLVTNSETEGPVEPLLADLSARLGPRLHSLHWNGNPARTNTILGPHFRRILGPEATEELIGGARVFFPPGAFGQSNLELADSIVALVHSWVPEGSRVLELYAGAGAIGLGLVPRVHTVAFNELGKDSLAGLKLGLAALPAELAARCTIAPGPAEEAAHLVEKASLVIADPPRKGLDGAVRAALVRAPPPRFVYVACGLASFLEDARTLVEARAMRLAQLVAFDLFPFTEHVEVVALFERTTPA